MCAALVVAAHGRRWRSLQNASAAAGIATLDHYTSSSSGRITEDGKDLTRLHSACLLFPGGTVSAGVADHASGQTELLRVLFLLRPRTLFDEFDEFDEADGSGLRHGFNGPAEIQDAGDVPHGEACAGESRHRDVFLLDLAAFIAIHRDAGTHHAGF
ncbi:MAG: hypothetical protein ACRD22_03670 [Terriglobia bacterium]